MLFRRNSDGRKQLLIVFVVGETPTTGVHKRALFKCFNIINQYHVNAGRAKPDRPPSVIDFRILGPCFSGSEHSLAFTISNWLDEYQAAEAPRARVDQIRAESFEVPTGDGPRLCQ